MVDVYFGKYIDESEGNIVDFKLMYIYDKGGVMDEIYGFYLFLENFLNWNFLNVLINFGDLRKFYI